MLRAAAARQGRRPGYLEFMPAAGGAAFPQPCPPPAAEENVPGHAAAVPVPLAPPTFFLQARYCLWRPVPVCTGAVSVGCLLHLMYACAKAHISIRKSKEFRTFLWAS